VVTIGFDQSALDSSFKSHAQRGIGRYVRELRRYFDQVDPEQKAIRGFDHTDFRLPRLVNQLIEFAPAGKQTIRQQLAYPLQLNLGKMRQFDLLHFPAHMDAPSWSSRRCIVTVLDLIPLIMKDLYKAERPGWRFELARFLEVRAIRRATLILAISETTKRDVQNILGIPEERIVVTPLGVDERFFTPVTDQVEVNRVFRKFQIPTDRPLLTYVGGIDPRKNWQVLLKLFADVIRAERGEGRPTPVLLMAGKIQADTQYRKLQKLVTELGIERDLITPGFVPDDELLALYSRATLFLFPSLYEGFGLPPLEAMAAGVPVVSSNTSCMPEILGDAALLFDPTDPAEGAKHVLTLLRSRELAERLREGGIRQARRFLWTRTGALTVKAYERFGKLDIGSESSEAVVADPSRPPPSNYLSAVRSG
jgi:glycosyltransferase involved in cell wall biosynthesis